MVNAKDLYGDGKDQYYVNAELHQVPVSRLRHRSEEFETGDIVEATLKDPNSIKWHKAVIRKKSNVKWEVVSASGKGRKQSGEVVRYNDKKRRWEVAKEIPKYSINLVRYNQFQRRWEVVKETPKDSDPSYTCITWTLRIDRDVMVGKLENKLRKL